MNILKPAMATTCVARNLENCLNRMKSHITAEFPKQKIVDSLQPYLLQWHTLWMPIRMSANSARRALWLKTWPSDAASKNRFVAFPLPGVLLLGAGQESILDCTADKNKWCWVKKMKACVCVFFFFFCPQKGQQEDKRRGIGSHGPSKNPTVGVECFSILLQLPKNRSDFFLPVPGRLPGVFCSREVLLKTSLS